MAARHKQHGKKLAEAERRAIVPCGECAKPAGLVDGRTIYPHRPDLAAKHFWKCVCGAYVGCHDGTFKPKGSPCGPKTRRARIEAHAACARRIQELEARVESLEAERRQRLAAERQTAQARAHRAELAGRRRD